VKPASVRNADYSAKWLPSIGQCKLWNATLAASSD
jgi:hypothetical protein